MLSMISLIQPLAAGNALRILLQPPDGAVWCRLRRNVGDVFVGPEDANALLVYEGNGRDTLDIAQLVNGTTYYYKPFYRIGNDWVAAPTVSAVPNASYIDQGGDVYALVRDRLLRGLKEEVRRGTLVHENGSIPVLSAPPLFEDAKFPIVTLHLTNLAPAERGVGETLGTDEFDETADQWTESEGYLARFQLTIMGWSLNPDERIEMRNALHRIVLANFPIFDFAGMIDVEFSVSDTEDMDSFSAPVYQVSGSLSCMAPVQVGTTTTAIDAVLTTIAINGV